MLAELREVLLGEAPRVRETPALCHTAHGERGIDFSTRAMEGVDGPGAGGGTEAPACPNAGRASRVKGSPRDLHGRTLEDTSIRGHPASEGALGGPGDHRAEAP